MSGPLSFVHRNIWQRLPREWRRLALFHATAWSAPRPAADVVAALPIIVAGALRTASGLGESARLCHDALKAAGLPVFGIDLTAGLMQPEDDAGFAFADGRHLTGRGTLVLHVNSPLVPLAMMRLGRAIVHQKRIIGCWAWELPGVPADWHHGIPFVHEIWAPSRFTAEAIEPIAAGRPVRVLPYAVALKSPLVAEHASTGASHGPGMGERPFTVLTIFNTASSFSRKNPLATIAAFRRAFDGDPSARLIVKTFNLSSYPQASSLIRDAIGSADNIVIIEQMLSASAISDLFSRADVVMSLHRSEGFGLTLAEGMLHAVAVVGTDWSGNHDFLTAQTGVPIPFRLVPAEDPQGTYNYPGMSWAEPDVEVAALALQRLRDAPELRRGLGQAAARFAATTWSADAYSRAVQSYLGVQ